MCVNSGDDFLSFSAAKKVFNRIQSRIRMGGTFVLADKMAKFMKTLPSFCIKRIILIYFYA